MTLPAPTTFPTSTTLGSLLNNDTPFGFVAPTPFVERRQNRSGGENHGRERRQFTNSHAELSPAAQELAQAIDGYKLAHRRRFIDFDEMLSIIQSLGYHK
jgi:hypothetical protein